MVIRFLFIGFLLLLGGSFFFQNQDRVITLRYFFGLQEVSTYVYVPVLTAFALGLVISSLLLFPGWLKARIALRRKTKALQEAESDLGRLSRSLEKAVSTQQRSGPVDVPERYSNE